MDQRLITVSLALWLATNAVAAGAAGFPTFSVRRCAPDAIVAGSVCLDRYEASVWRVPNPTTTNRSLIRKIQLGMVTRANLIAGGATWLGATANDYAPCTRNGQTCANDIYAVSLPSEMPSPNITWFQAQEACANAGKRLPTNSEWQMGANGTPDAGPDNGTTDCNTASAGTPTLTGTRAGCVSGRGAFDMVGNLAEWVADWVPVSTDCPSWGSFSNDDMCLSGASETATGPAALIRGGAFTDLSGALAGPLAVRGTVLAFRATNIVGFRCAR